MKSQIKAARVLLDITQAELCADANIPLITLRRIEGRPDHKGLVSNDTVDSVRLALEARGIQFLENGQVAAGPGVALRASEEK